MIYFDVQHLPSGGLLRSFVAEFPVVTYQTDPWESGFRSLGQPGDLDAFMVSVMDELAPPGYRPPRAIQSSEAY